jgi:predicted phosphohydrolase
MRIVALADTHMFHEDLRVPEGDVLVHAGDLCRGGDLAQLQAALEWIRGLPHRHKVIIAGNHDWAFQRHPEAARSLCGTDLTYLEDSAAAINGLRFWGSPWQPEFNDWAFNLPRGKALARKWALIPKSLDVLITHGPPAGMGDRSSVSGRQGCEDLRARVAEVRPRVHLFGHIHEDGGVWQQDGVVFANVATWECERPPTVFDIDAKSVTTVFAPPREGRVPS